MTVLLAALVAVAVPAAEASIPPPESWGSPVEEPAASVLELPSLKDMAPELAALLPPPATAAEASAGEPFRLFQGLELGLARRSEPRFRLYPRLETRVRAITLPEPLHIELELPLTTSRFKLYGDPPAGIAVGGTFLTTDPLGYVDGPNLYQYGVNNPINFADPMGLCTGAACADLQAAWMEIHRRQQEAREQEILAWQRWEDQETLKGGLGLIQQIGREVSHYDLQNALLAHFKSRPRVSESDAYGLVVALTGPGEGVNDVLGELQGIGRWAEVLDAYLINYPLAITGGELTFGVRALASNARQVGWRTAVQQIRGVRPTSQPVPRATTGAIGAADELVTVGEFGLSRTVSAHVDDLVKRGHFRGEPARPYLESPHTIREIMRGGTPVPDPGGAAGALRWDVPGTFRGSQGTWELVVDPNNTILHLNFVR